MSKINHQVESIMIMLEALLDVVDQEQDLGTNFNALLEEFIDEMACFRQLKSNGDFFYVIPGFEPSKCRATLSLVR